MKPTLKIALLSAGDEARRWLQRLTQHQERDCWRAFAETEVNRYDLTVGMPALGHPHAAVVIVDPAEGVTPLLTRSLWHAQRRGIKRWFALLHAHEADHELLDAATLELREGLQAVGLPGDELSVLSATDNPGELAALREQLYSMLDANASYEDAPLAALPAARLLRRLLFYDPESSGLWREELWAKLSLGEAPRPPFDLLWRFYSILAQACRGYFDDVPGLIEIAAGTDERQDEPYARLSLELMGHIGTWELLPRVEGFLNGRTPRFYFPDELLFYAIRHWSYLGCVPVLLSLKEFSRASGVSALREDKAEQILGARSWALEEALTRARQRYPESQALFHGEPFSVAEVAARAPLASQGEELRRNLSDLFRAQTGQHDTPRDRYIFLQSRAASFQVGRRYFNGHELFDYATQHK